MGKPPVVRSGLGRAWRRLFGLEEIPDTPAAGPLPAPEVRPVAGWRPVIVPADDGMARIAVGVAHELNNRLAGVTGYCEIALASLPEDAPARRQLRAAIESAERVGLLAQRLLLCAGKGPRSREVVAINALCEDAVARVRRRLPSSCVLHLRLGQGLPPLRGDAAQLGDVVAELLTNAGEAAEPGRPCRIELSTALRTLGRTELAGFTPLPDLAAGGWLVLEVEDTGGGIAPGIAAHIFEPFFSTRFQGRGLGLATVLGVLRAHGGAIRCVSAPGRGSVFTVLLPVAGTDAGECGADGASG